MGDHALDQEQVKKTVDEPTASVLNLFLAV
jgi:hypothetical protein